MIVFVAMVDINIAGILADEDDLMNSLAGFIGQELFMAIDSLRSRRKDLDHDHGGFDDRVIASSISNIARDGDIGIVVVELPTGFCSNKHLHVRTVDRTGAG